VRSLARLSAAAGFFFLVALCPSAPPAAEEEKAEIKLLVAPAKTDEAMTKLKLTPPAPKNYKIYFVDTEDFKLNSRGVILRLRDKGKKEPETETTVKFRPDDQSKAPDLELPNKPEKETEWLIGKGKNLSYSLKQEIKGTELLENPGENLAALFSDEQKAFFKLITMEEFGSVKLKVFGPIPAQIWELQEPPPIDDEVSVELWKLGDERILEISRKAKAKNLKEKANEFAAAFKDRATVDADPESKTRKALKHFSKDHPEAKPK